MREGAWRYFKKKQQERESNHLKSRIKHQILAQMGYIKVTLSL
jgi:hypothetical protein